MLRHLCVICIFTIKYCMTLVSHNIQVIVRIKSIADKRFSDRFYTWLIHCLSATRSLSVSCLCCAIIARDRINNGIDLQMFSFQFFATARKTSRYFASYFWVSFWMSKCCYGKFVCQIAGSLTRPQSTLWRLFLDCIFPWLSFDSLAFMSRVFRICKVLYFVCCLPTSVKVPCSDF